MPHPRPGRVVAEKQYADLVLSMAPVSFWRLGERSGTVARDAFGGNHGTYVGAPTLGVLGALAGDGSSAATFDTTGKYATHPAITLGGAATWLAWVYRTSFVSATWMAGGFGGTSKLGFTAGKMFARFLNAGASDNTVAAPSPNAAWHMLTLTRGSDDVVRLYVDTTASVLFGGAAQSGSFGPTVLGIDNAFTQTLGGSLDEVAIWNRAITAAEVAALYAAGAGQ